MAKRSEGGAKELPKGNPNGARNLSNCHSYLRVPKSMKSKKTKQTKHVIKIGVEKHIKSSKMDAKSISKSIKNHEQKGAPKVMQNDAPNGGRGGWGGKEFYQRLRF